MTTLLDALKSLIAQADAGQIVDVSGAQTDAPDANGAVAFTNLPATSGGNGKRFIVDELVKQTPAGSHARLFGVANLNRERAEALIVHMNLIECLDIVVHTDDFGNTLAGLDKNKPVHGTYALDPTTCGTVAQAFAMLSAWNPTGGTGTGGNFVP